MRSATLHSAAPCRLVLGSFLLLQTLGLYSSLPLEGMIRISFYHTVVSFKFLFVWLVLLASISAALPSIPQASSCCGETTGKHGVLCTRLGLLLHYRVEVWVLHGLFGSQSLLMVIPQELVKKI